LSKEKYSKTNTAKKSVW